jgi:hypothetical protein
VTVIVSFLVMSCWAAFFIAGYFLLDSVTRARWPDGLIYINLVNGGS